MTPVEYYTTVALFLVINLKENKVMKFILLYRGRLGNQNFRLFNTREEAHDFSRSEGMIDKEVFGVFELDNPAVVPSFF